jgi:hypothetical protein
MNIEHRKDDQLTRYGDDESDDDIVHGFYMNDCILVCIL